MKHKVGDRVRIKSIDWYNENKDKDGNIPLNENTNSKYNFIKIMLGLCGKVMTISRVKIYSYDMVEDNGEYFWTDEMIEGLVEEETLIERVDDNGLPFNEWLSHKGAFYIPDGYELKDENGNVINATKIVLEKKKKEYPKTFLGCCDVLGIEDLISRGVNGYRSELLDAFQKLLICRDAYWKLYEEEMGLGKPWSSDLTDNVNKHCIEFRDCGVCKVTYSYTSRILSFPTEEMRDAFYENFKEEIEQRKELL